MFKTFQLMSVYKIIIICQSIFCCSTISHKWWGVIITRKLVLFVSILHSFTNRVLINKLFVLKQITFSQWPKKVFLNIICNPFNQSDFVIHKILRNVFFHARAGISTWGPGMDIEYPFPGIGIHLEGRIPLPEAS